MHAQLATTFLWKNLNENAFLFTYFLLWLRLIKIEQWRMLLLTISSSVCAVTNQYTKRNLQYI